MLLLVETIQICSEKAPRVFSLFLVTVVNFPWVPCFKVRCKILKFGFAVNSCMMPFNVLY